LKQRDYYSLNEGEEVIGKSKVASVLFDRGGFVLTNQRVIQVQRSKMGGKSEVVSFFLENLDSIQNKSRRFLGCGFIAALALVAAIASVFAEFLEAAGILGFAALFFWITYLATRKRLVTLSSGRAEIVLDVRPFSVNTIQEFVFEIEQAKAARLSRLHGYKQSGVESSDAEPKEGPPKASTERMEGGNSPKGRLLQAKELFEAGLITEEEYQEKRRQILDTL